MRRKNYVRKRCMACGLAIVMHRCESFCAGCLATIPFTVRQQLLRRSGDPR